MFRVHEAYSAEVSCCTQMGCSGFVGQLVSGRCKKRVAYIARVWFWCSRCQIRLIAGWYPDLYVEVLHVPHLVGASSVGCLVPSATPVCFAQDVHTTPLALTLHRSNGARLQTSARAKTCCPFLMLPTRCAAVCCAVPCCLLARLLRSKHDMHML